MLSAATLSAMLRIKSSLKKSIFDRRKKKRNLWFFLQRVGREIEKIVKLSEEGMVFIVV
jgi:hypothetical protein